MASELAWASWQHQSHLMYVSQWNVVRGVMNARRRKYGVLDHLNQSTDTFAGLIFVHLTTGCSQ